MTLNMEAPLFVRRNERCLESGIACVICAVARKLCSGGVAAPNTRDKS